jgi:hypothetical protein
VQGRALAEVDDAQQAGRRLGTSGAGAERAGRGDRGGGA